MKAVALAGLVFMAAGFAIGRQGGGGTETARSEPPAPAQLRVNAKAPRITGLPAAAAPPALARVKRKRQPSDAGSSTTTTTTTTTATPQTPQTPQSPQTPQTEQTPQDSQQPPDLGNSDE